MLAFRLVPALAVLVSCTQQDVPPASRSAQFDQHPERLFDTFETGCSGPGETFQKVSKRSYECREFLPPETTAYLILNYSGDPQDLPQSVMRLTSTKNEGGYRVDARLFFNVPQRSGATVEIPVESKALDQTLGALYQRMGGSPT